MSLVIWSDEGEKLIKLTDVDHNLSQEDLLDKLAKKLSERELDILLDFASEADIVNSTEDVSWCDNTDEMTLNEYVTDFQNNLN